MAVCINQSLHFWASGIWDSSSLLSNSSCSFTDFLHELLPSSGHWMLRSLRLPLNNGLQLARDLGAGHCRFVSDGSFYPSHQRGAAATILQGLSPRSEIVLSAPTPGTPDKQSAYRSELMGILLSVVVCRGLCEFYRVPTDSTTAVTIACDGESALRQGIMEAEAPLRTSAQHYDLILAIRLHLKHISVSVTPHHVLGHQQDRHLIVPAFGYDGDRGVGLAQGPLDRLASMNEQADAYAKQFCCRFYLLEEASSATLSQPSLLGTEVWPVLLPNGDKVTCKLTKSLHDYITGHALKTYWRDHREWDVSDKTDWDCLTSAVRQLPTTRRTFHIKAASTFLPVRRCLNLRGHSDQDSCPCCANESQGPPFHCETVQHMYQCLSQSTTLQ